MKFIKSTIPFITFTLLALLLYHKVLNTPFVIDDEWYIINNSEIKDITALITNPSGTRFIGFLTFAINYYFSGLNNTYGYHIVNILIHILNTSLVYLLIKITLNRLKNQDSRLETQNSEPSTLDYLPFTVSLIFLVHPIQTQAVSYISQRFSSLATLFYLLSIVLYVKARTKEHRAEGIGQRVKSLRPMPYALCILSTILAMKTKEISFTLPFIILLYEFTFLNNSLKPSALCPSPYVPRRLLYLIPFFLTLIIIPLSLFGSDLLIDKNSVDISLRELQLLEIREFSTYTYLITQFRVIITYIRLMLVPINQHFWYDYPLSNSIFEPATLISFLVLLLIFVFAVYLLIRSRITQNAHGLLFSFGILWFFITLSIESSIIPIKDVIFEHRLYLPSVGFILSITTAIFFSTSYIRDRWGELYFLKEDAGVVTIKKSLHIYLFAMVFIIIMNIFSFSTYKRNILWGDSLLFNLDEVKKSPNIPEPHNNLGEIYYEKGFIDKALELFQIVLKLNPDYPNAHNNMGNIYFDKGLSDTAIEHYQIAIRLKPDFPKAYYNLGNLYSDKELLDTAIEHYQIAIRLKPDFPEAYYNLGNIYSKKGLFDAAIEHYQIALRLKPDYIDTHNNLGIIYGMFGQFDKALIEFGIVIQLNYDYADAHYNMGNVYYEKGNLDEAIKKFQTTLKLNPDHTNAYKMIEKIKRKKAEDIEKGETGSK